MKKIIRNILLLMIIMGFRGILIRHDITIKLKVHGTDANLTGKILSDLRNDLGNKPNIVIVSDTTDSSTFMISVGGDLYEFPADAKNKDIKRRIRRYVAEEFCFINVQPG